MNLIYCLCFYTHFKIAKPFSLVKRRSYPDETFPNQRKLQAIQRRELWELQFSQTIFDLNIFLGSSEFENKWFFSYFLFITIFIITFVDL